MIFLASAYEMDSVKTFECGQCFRWNCDENNVYTGVVRGTAAKITTRDGALYLQSSDPEKTDMWRDYFDLDVDYENIRLAFDGGEYLKKWLEMCPMKQFTTLDTHDGIGIVDVKDLLPDEEIDKVKEQMYSQGANVKKIYSSEAYNNLDIYQVNTTYYSALGNNDDAYLLARAIQFFAPGIPQVYYVGLLAGSNDTDLMERTKNGRDINRHYYSAEEIDIEQERKVVREIKALMELRNSHPAFGLEGTISVSADGDRLTIIRVCGENRITLNANLTDYSFTIY